MSTPAYAYKYNQTITVRTTQAIPYSMILAQFATEQAFLDTLAASTEQNIKDSFTASYAEKGFTISVDWARINYTMLDPEAKASGMAVAVTQYQIEFQSDDVLHVVNASFVLTAFVQGVIIAISIGLAIIIGALLSPLWSKNITDWLTSMTTHKTVSEQYGWVLNPDTGLHEWHLLSSVTSTEPSPIGIFSVMFAVIGLAVAGIILLGFGPQLVKSISSLGKSKGKSKKRR